MRSRVRTRTITLVAEAARRALALTLVASMLMLSVPAGALASIYKMPEEWVSSPTNPGDVGSYGAVWREGWGNDPLPEFNLTIPQPEAGEDEDGFPVKEPAIVGGFYYTTRPGSLDATINAGLWPDAYMAPISDKDNWKLFIDIPSEVNNAQPGDLFSRWFEPPYAPWVAPVVPKWNYEGPFQTFIHYYAKDTTECASGTYAYGVDVTPPGKVENLTAVPGFGMMSPTGWLTQSRILLKWEDLVYDNMSGTGYFEAFIDGKPYPALSGAEGASRRVYDLKEHYPGYGISIPTKRQMTLEDLPAGEHKLQVRAVDRATNEGSLSEPAIIKVDPDIPRIAITSPAVPGETLGAKPVLAADATDMAGIQYVTFTVARSSSPGVVIETQTDFTEPYEMTADLTAPSHTDGSEYIVTAETVDMAGRGKDVSETFVIDKKPTVKIVAPAVGSAQPNLVALKAEGQDKSGVSSVDIRVDGGPITSYVPPSADTTSVPVTMLRNLGNGLHTMDVTVWNASGGRADDSRSFVVDGQLRPSSTVPYATEVGESGAQSRWTAWQNNPILSFNTELTTVEGATELLYLVDRSPMTTIDPTTPNLYYSSSNVTANSSLYEGTIDLLGVYLSNPGTFAGSLQLPGATEDLEGLWYTHALVRNASSEAGPLSHVVYGVDMTEPSIVTGLAAYPDNNSATPVSGWLEQTRAVLRWDGAQYDSLSGVHHYNVYIDGAPAGDELSAVPYEHGRGRMSLTIENLAPGPHAIQVSAVDQAGNEGPLSSPTTVRIKSTPTISIGSPVADGVTIGTPVTLRARVKDPSGVTSVVFTVEGMPSQTFTPGPNDATDMSCSMLSPLLSGNYTLTVTAHSASGTSKTVQRFFTVDSSLPQETDPGDPGDPGDDEGEPPVVTPAYQWFNTRFPSFNAMPSDEPTAATELLYLVDRTPNSPIDADNPNAYYSSFRVEEGTTHVNGVVDQYGVYLSDPSSFDGAIQLPGRVTQPMEGTWYLHALFRNSLGDAGPTAHVAYGVDLTPPAAVTDVNVYSSNTDTTPLTGWLDQSRVVIRWDGSERDLLSGTDHYRVYVDGQSLSEATDAIAFQSGRATMSVTVEDLAPGAHKIQVTAVDKAGNESAMSGSAYARLDAGIPTVKVTSPSKAGAKLNLASTLAAYATDEVSVESVTFRVDGVTVGTVRPDGTQMNVDAKVKPDWTRFSSGSHTLSVSVADQVGHVVSASRSFTLDRTAPTLSSVTGGYNPFYPRKRDGYRDYYYTHFKSSEAGTAKLVIKDSKGNTWRTIYKAVPSGSSTVRWDGKSNDGSMKEGTFRWYLKVKDAAGNYSTTKSGSTSLRYYVVVKTGTNTVKLVAH